MAASLSGSEKSDTSKPGQSGKSSQPAGSAGSPQSGSASTSTPRDGSGTREDLTRIKGIGPATSRLLSSHSVNTYSDVANQTPASLGKMLGDGGPAFASNDPASWPEQARLAMDGKWSVIDNEYGADGVRISGSTSGSSTLSSSGSSAAVAGAAATGAVAAGAAASSPSRSTSASTGSGAKGDDLTSIVGIGPKASELLNADGIVSFNDLANADQPRLRGIIERGGSRFTLLDSETWPEQARLASGGEWSKLSDMQSKMSDSAFASKTFTSADSGAPAAKSAAPSGTGKPDDLTRVEGIGPKIGEVLRDAGINSFRELSVTPESTLRAVLEKAGPRFVLADPGTWPEQAKLAADNRWDDLKKLQDDLDGGRRV